MRRIFVFLNVLILADATVIAQSRFNYSEKWNAIERLMEGILPQSALPEIEALRQAALRDSEYGHLIKAVMTRNTCLQMTEEKPQIAVINSLTEDIQTVPFPARAMIYSLLGEAYLNFYNENRWQIYNRTAVATESEDVETWEAARLIREIAHYYRLSLMEAEQLQKTSIAAFKEALQENTDTRYLRPTLYDFLAHRTIDE